MLLPFILPPFVPVVVVGNAHLIYSSLLIYITHKVASKESLKKKKNGGKSDDYNQIKSKVRDIGWTVMPQCAQRAMNGRRSGVLYRSQFQKIKYTYK